MFRFRELYPKDLNSHAIQKDLNKTIRLARITSVNPQEGIVTIQWFDRPGMRTDVVLTQPSANSYFIPKKGTIVLVGFDSRDQARILQYIPIGQSTRVKKLKTLPKLQEDDSFIESGGSYVYVRANGDIIITTATESYLLLENSTGTLKSETTNWKALTQAGYEYLGLIKRFQVNTDGTSSLNLIQDTLGKYLTEYNLKILETADDETGVQGLESPIVSISFGTVVDSQGIVVAKNDALAPSPEKQLAARIDLKSGIRIDIDKEGRVSVSNAKININEAEVDTSDPDISLKLETASQKGKRGQHVAREHDKISIPISSSFTDENHTGLTELASTNVQVLQILAAAIMSPTGPCTLNPALIPANTKLQGEITEGADNMYVGDK